MIKHNLDQAFLDQVADFILKNAEGVSVGSSGYQDPFTGGTVIHLDPTQPPVQQAIWTPLLAVDLIDLPLARTTPMEEQVEAIL